ncbi:uncharacterized protein LOC108031302 [Drosophila biarmipes]|uniref:uncharacterized protein LOC108031302 n=1 Tax=Drosophila biarmipes TaxID=125945 RepID=UPI0007E86839|nr:uncharacterized protein LOC108031302 [Drosophila biarmipes]
MFSNIPPSMFCVLIWRLAVQFLYPYAYMNCSLQEALDNEHLIWSKGDRFEELLMILMRSSLRVTLMFVLMMEILTSVNEALGMRLPLAVRP